MNKRIGRSILNVLMILTLTLLVYTPGFAQGQGPGQQFQATPLTPDSTFTNAGPKQFPSYKPGTGTVSVVVKLKGEPLATYSGGVPGFAPTNPKVTGAPQLDLRSKNSQAYLQHLAQLQNAFESKAFKAVPQAKSTHRFDVLLNAVSMLVPAEQVKTLATLPEVEAIYPDELLQVDTDNSPQFIGAPTVWNQLGGQESAGEGVIVGVLDTGIWPEHPSFSDPDPSGKPYAAPPPPPSGTPRACQFSGGANPGAPFTCNNKLIGAYRFMNTYEASISRLPSEYTSARDDDGHGTHTSSTAAGNAGVAASIFGIPRGTVSGIAPRARVIMYKVCGASGCFSSDSAAAVQQAILDGVNVINFSISGGANPYSDAVEQAFLNAYNAGVFVAASAGNSGPGLDTTDHRGPWVTTVAASTQNRAFENTATVTADGGASLTLHGASLTRGIGPAPVFVPTGAGADVRCDNPFAAGSVAGKIVVCQRGNTGRAQKGYNVLQGGAVGMILYNQAANVTDLETDNHFLPAIHIQFTDGQTLLSFISSHTNVQATLTQGVKVPAQGDVMASFSSRGGPNQTLGVSKPDITAPGVQILAGASPQHLTPADGGFALGPEGELFQAIAGTSMSSPHIAGSGALIKALHPNWTPGQIKSALMTTAWTQVVKEDGVTPANAFDDGSGRVDLNKAGNPGLTFDETAAGYVAHQNDLWNANYPSVYVPVMPGVITLQRTAHSTLPYDNPWELQVKGATDFTVAVANNLTVPANGNATFNITIDARNVPIGQVRMATLYLVDRATQGAHTLHIPITFVRKQAPVTLTKSCSPSTIAKGAVTNCVVTFQNTTFNNATVSVIDSMPQLLDLVPASVVGGVVSSDKKTVSFNGTLAAAQPPNVTVAAGSAPFGYLPLSGTPISSVGDETISNFTVPAFTYGGQTYTRVGMVSDGYLVVGGGTGADVQFVNQNLPDPTRPNNVLAPFWTDLNPAFGGAMRAAVLSSGSNSWIVFDWQGVVNFSNRQPNTFQVWLPFATNTGTVNGVSANQTFFAYGTITTGEGGALTIGAENIFGNRGQNYYFNGTGSLPAPNSGVYVNSAAGAPGETHTIRFSATGNSYGKWVNYAQLTSNLFQGTSIASFAGEVTK